MGGRSARILRSKEVLLINHGLFSKDPPWPVRNEFRHVFFTPEQVAKDGGGYNYGTSPYAYEDLPGVSVFLP